MGPIIITGLGGSGTRLVARICQELGVHIGRDLNGSLDNLLFTMLFKLPYKYSYDLYQDTSEIGQKLLAFKRSLLGERLHPRDIFVILTAAIAQISMSDRYSARWAFHRVYYALRRKAITREKWGWKEPHSAFFLNTLDSAFDDCKLILVMRNGLDMAYSINDQQSKYWHRFFSESPMHETPYARFSYWYLYNHHVMEFSQRILGKRAIWIKLEDLCTDSAHWINRLNEFLELGSCPDRDVYELPKLPKTANRYLDHNLEWVTADVLSKLDAIGYRADPQ